MTDLGSAPVPAPSGEDHRREPASTAGDYRREPASTAGDHPREPASTAEDHRREPASTGEARPRPEAAEEVVVIVYADFECPYCAAVHARLTALSLPLIFRHFPVRSSHPRAWPAACAAEAAGRQGRFWQMHDALFADQSRLEDPHLWAQAQRLGLNVDRFDADRRSDAVRDRVQRDFRSGVRAGVVTTPALFVWRDGRAEAVDISALEQGV